MLSLVDQLLLFRKAESGLDKIRPSNLNLHDLAYEVYLCFVQQARSQGIMYVFDCPNKEVEIYADREKLEIILYNLLSNALKYTPAINRKPVAGKIISRLNKIMSEQFSHELLKQKGLPTVENLASQLHLSPSYLSDLLKQETGKTAQEHIHIFLIDEAKNLLRSTNNTIAETAFSLGFENPPYFSRLFKKQTGITPKEFREQLIR